MTIRFSVPMLPPLVNRAVRHGGGKHYKTPAVDRFALLVRSAAQGQKIVAKTYTIGIGIYLPMGKLGRKSDLDGYAKYAIDALVTAGVIVDDNRITGLVMDKYCECGAEATEYVIQSADPADVLARMRQANETEDNPIPTRHFDEVEIAF